MIDLGLFLSISQGTLPWQPILWKNGKLPTFVALPFRNRMVYHYINVCINSINDASISCKNLVKFAPVGLTPEWSELICERLVWHGQKTGVFGRTSPELLDRFLQSLHHMRALWVQVINLDLIFRFGKEHCHGNQCCCNEGKLILRAFFACSLGGSTVVSLLPARRRHCGAERAIC